MDELSDPAVGTREQILAAAERLVAGEGGRNLTIARVAEAAGMSKGGVLYHFASKEALIEAMVQRFIGRMQAAIDAEVRADPSPFGRFTRAYLRAVVNRNQETQATGTLLAALAYAPGLLAPLHERLLQWQRQTEEELDPTTAAVLRLAAHAILTNDWLLPNDLNARQLKAIQTRLEAMTRRV